MENKKRSCNIEDKIIAIVLHNDASNIFLQSETINLSKNFSRYTIYFSIRLYEAHQVQFFFIITETSSSLECERIKKELSRGVINFVPGDHDAL